jgi:hypothetical protein
MAAKMRHSQIANKSLQDSDPQKIDFLKFNAKDKNLARRVAEVTLTHLALSMLHRGIAKTIIRESNLAAKGTWPLQLLGLKSLTKKWLTRINDIAELRNAFVQYKWQPEPDHASTSSKAQNERKLKYAEGIVRYLRIFEDRALYAGKGRHIMKVFKNSRVAK